MEVTLLAIEGIHTAALTLLAFTRQGGQLFAPPLKGPYHKQRASHETLSGRTAVRPSIEGETPRDKRRKIMAVRADSCSPLH